MSVRPHPKPCFTCPLQPGSIGFLADSVPEHPKIWVLKYHPTSGEIENDQEKLAAMRHFWEKDYLIPNGLNFEDLAICHVLRCRPKKDVVGKTKKISENICRQYDAQSGDKVGKLRDGGIQQANIDSFIITFDHLDCIDVPARKLFVRKSFELANLLVKKGHTPMLLMGKDAAKLVYPSLFSTRTRDRETGFKNWVGHYWFGGWPFALVPKKEKTEESALIHVKLVEQAAFKELTTKYKLR